MNGPDQTDELQADLIELQRLMPLIGVTRLARLTDLDCIGLPVFSAVRDEVVGESITVCTGKGTTNVRAKIGAIAEALERYSAEPRNRISICESTFSELDDAVDPTSLILADWASPKRILDWVRASDLETNANRYVPANAVFFPYYASEDKILFAANTTGLAVAKRLDQAIERAMLECVERDAYSRALIIATYADDADNLCPAICPSACSDLVCHWVEMIENNGLHVLLRDLTGDLAIPTFLCTIMDDTPAGRIVHAGCASDYDANSAVLQAVAEACQSRVTDFQGGREDLPDHEDRAEVDPWFFESNVLPVKKLPASLVLNDCKRRISLLRERLIELELESPLYVDLSVDDTYLKTVRVICPGLEVWAKDPSRIGPRVRKWISEFS